jgi:hypothetical protein
MAMSYRLKKLNQSGMVSIIVTIVLIIVLSLIVIAMSRNSIREQRQSLDRQLSDQAFYNAESGINDWVNKLFTDPALPASKDDCAPGDLSTIGTEGTNSYTCVLYNKTPEELVYEGVGLNNGKTVEINPTAGLDELTFTWTPDNDNPEVSGCNLGSASSALPASLPVGCDAGVLELTIIDPSVLNRDDLINNQSISYFLPNNSGSVASVDIATSKGRANQGRRIPTLCDTATKECKATVRVNIASGSKMFANFKFLYNSSNLRINGKLAGNLVKFVGAQYMLDVTGKANDVLRRVQVRVPVKSQFDGTNFSIQTSESLCKLIETNVNGASSTATWQTNADGDAAQECPIN